MLYVCVVVSLHTVSARQIWLRVQVSLQKCFLSLVAERYIAENLILH